MKLPPSLNPSPGPGKGLQRNMRKRIAGVVLMACGLVFGASDAGASDVSIAQLPRGGEWARLFAGSEPHADVRDGYFRGFAYERRQLLPDGGLRVMRVKIYTHVEHPDTHRVVKLKDRWTATSVMDLTPALRLARETMRLDFRKSIDDVLDGYEFTEEHDDFFEWDEMRVRALGGGTKLARTQILRGKVVLEEVYDYGADDVPVEIVGLVLSAAVKRGLRAFDFDLLMPGGSTHGIHAVVHTTRDLRPYGKKYGFPRKVQERLQSSEDVALLEMHLASPVKYLLYPHKFYLAYERAAPENAIAFWGGEPGKHLYAFRTDADAPGTKAGSAVGANAPVVDAAGAKAPTASR